MNSEDFVRWLRAVAPYIHAFRGKTFVVGLAGELVAAGRTTAEEILRVLGPQSGG